MRPALALAALLLLTTSVAGCFETNGTLVVQLQVSPTGAIGQFRTLNITLDDVRLRARTVDPQPVDATTTRIELVSAAATQDTFPLFRQQVRADHYSSIVVAAPPGSSFEGILRNGTKVGVVMPGNALSLETDFEMARGGTIEYLFVVTITQITTGVGAPVFRVVASPDDSRVIARSG